MKQLTIAQAAKALDAAIKPLLRQLPPGSEVPKRVTDFIEAVERDISALQQEVAQLQQALQAKN